MEIPDHLTCFLRNLYAGQEATVRTRYGSTGASLVAQIVKASACSAGYLGSIPGSGRSPGEGNDNSLQYSCLENSMDGGAWSATVHGVAKSQTRLSDFTHSLRLFCKGTGSLYNSNCSVQVPISQLSWSVLIVNIHPFDCTHPSG